MSQPESGEQDQPRPELGLKPMSINTVKADDPRLLAIFDEQKENEDQLTIELTFKKVITINNADINDKQCLDKAISEIKNFCDQAVSVNNYVYLPLNMREKNNANTRAGSTWNSI